MEKKRFVIILCAVIIISGCHPVKKTIVITGNKNDNDIQSAILDFSKTTKLYKKNSAFSVWLLGISTDRDVMVVTIGRRKEKFSLTSDAKVGSTGHLPSRYLEKDGR